MTVENFKDIIDHQFKLMIKEKHMQLTDLSKYEALQWKYDIALKLLAAL